MVVLIINSLLQGLYSLSGKTLIARSREASKPRDSGLNFSNRSEIWQHPISRLRDFTRFGGKTSYRLVNRGPVSYWILSWRVNGVDMIQQKPHHHPVSWNLVEAATHQGSRLYASSNCLVTFYLLQTGGIVSVNLYWPSDAYVCIEKLSRLCLG